VQPEEYRQASLKVWEAMAPGWERWRVHLEQGVAPVHDWLIRELAPRPGDTVLELASGTGDLGFKAARIIGDEGRLISTDFSPDMVDVARRYGAERGVENVEFRVMDAEAIDLDDDSIDGVLCQSGYMLMADVEAALAETRRVLRPGRRLALSVWGAPERNPWASIGARILIERGHMPPPEPGMPGVFSMAAEERSRGLLAGAGFDEIRTDEVEVRFRFSDVDDYMQWATDMAGPIAIVLRGLSEDELQTLTAQLEEGFAPFSADGGYTLPGVALCAVAS
jgi:ubiquinone/menaquinone biosynthesis C-methylase UbiE